MNGISHFMILSIVTALLLDSCKDMPETKVRYAGALHQMMFGNLQATASLDTLKQKQNLYAIGAVENLKGEIQIFEGRPLNSSVNLEEITFDRTFDQKAALLVYAQVAKWQSVKIPKSLYSAARWEEFIALKAKDSGIDISKPFPFLIEGNVKSLKWHVIDWEEGDMVHSHEMHKQSGIRGVLENEEVEIIGFYSESHQTVFTHHSTFVHLHFKRKDEKLAGHIDDLQLGSNMILKLPKF